MLNSRNYKMGDHIMEGGSSTSLAPIQNQTYDANVDYIIGDYMERLGTRLNILETELKYAWRALDLLSQEYIKMWERLEKLEGLLYEQQSVIAQLLDFYTAGNGGRHGDMMSDRNAILDGRLGELEVIREILGNGIVEDGLEEGVDVTNGRMRSQKASIQEIEELEMDEIGGPDEAFYRSLNQAYREDLGLPDTKAQASQLGMIWEEHEEVDNGEEKNELKELEDEMRLDERQDVYSSLDYKDYRGNSPCISEQDIAQLSRIGSIDIDHMDHIAIEKLNELDRLSSKLQQDSMNIKHLQRKLLESPHKKSNKDQPTEEKVKKIDKEQIEEQIRQVYEECENWSFSGGIRNQDELILIAKSDIPTTISGLYSNRPSSRLSVTESITATDNEVAETLAGGMRTPTSPRRRQSDSVASCSAPFTTVTGRLAYSTAVHNVETAEAAAAASHNPFISKNPFYSSSTDFNELGSLMGVTYETIHSSTPSIFSIKSERAPSPTLSICSVRTRQDGYVGAPDVPPGKSNGSSPPPPAPRDMCQTFLMPMSTVLPGPQAGPSPVFLGADTAPTKSITSHERGRLSPKVPHSPKSPKTSPKRSKSHSSTINTAKSDSGLSSMSGWSSLEKSPGSPKNGAIKPHTLHYMTDNRHVHLRSTSPMPPHQANQIQNTTRPFTESDTDTINQGPLQVPVCNSILPGGHHLSAFTTVKSPCSLETTEGYGTFVPAPAPASDINVSPRPKPKLQTKVQSDHMYRNEQPAAIYSVAGSNRQETYTSVYTSNSTDYINQAVKYPDLIEPYDNNELLDLQQRQYVLSTSTQMLHSSPDMHATRRKSLSRTYSTSNGTSADGVHNHDGYKVAMQRTMFPTGNITDALSYYPTSSRYDSSGVLHLPNADYNDPANWLNCPESQYPVDSASTSSSMRSMETAESGYSQSPYLDQRRHPQQQQQHPQTHSQEHLQNLQQQQQHLQYQQQKLMQQQQQIAARQAIPPQPIYQNTLAQDPYAAWNQRQDIPYLELDLRNRNVPEYIVHQQDGKFYDANSGIVTQSGYISISSQMNEQQMQQMQQIPTLPPQKSSKKLKRTNTLKSAMNSVSNWLPDLHLSKRNRSYSLPGNSVDDNTVVHTPKSATSKSMFNRKKKKIVSTVSGILQKAKRKSFHHAQSLSDPEQSENEWANQRASSMLSEDDRSEDSYSIFSEYQADRDLFEKVVSNKKPTIPESSPSQGLESISFDTVKRLSPMPTQPQESITPKTDQDTDVSDHFLGDEEVSGKSTGSGSSGMFATIGDVKRNSGPSDKSGDDSTCSESKSIPPLNLGGASMEFAVSRALGKYRKRQTSSSLVDDQEETSDKQDDSKSDILQEPEMLKDFVDKKPDKSPVIEQKSTESTASSQNSTKHNHFSNDNEGSPATSFRANLGRFGRHQASLEIPGFDEDTRSTHSWRSGSRVSSRRQSTEDSIDSEDEWYCYELKKLEEMERQSALEAEMGAPLKEVEETEDVFEPDERVKEKMTFVLRELRIKSKVIEGVLEEKDNNLHVISSAKHRGNHTSYMDEDDDLGFEYPISKPNEYDPYDREPLPETAIEAEEAPSDDEDASSGATSGPDSPQHSISEFEEAESAIADEFARCTKLTGFPDEKDEATMVKPIDVPKIQIDLPISVAEDEQKDDGKDSGPLGSKWKLLKALKERKAEDKINQEKVAETPTEKEKVGTGTSMFGMMQKFYEVHVKT